VVPAVFAICSAGIVLNQILTDPLESASGFLLVAAGVPVYFALVLRDRK
jgi:hypothetical protein